MFSSTTRRPHGATPKKRKAGKDFPFAALSSSLLRILPAIVGGVVAALLITGVWTLINRMHLTVTQVNFDQVLLYEDNQTFQQYLKALQGRDLIRDDLKIIKADIESLPWIATASVRFEWPGALNVSVVEERPIAIWNQNQLISQTGKLFAPDKTLFALASLSGPENTHELVIERYIGFNTAMISVGQSIQELKLSVSGSWQMTTEQGTEIKLGSDEVQKRFERVLAVLANLQQQAVQLDYLDARYPNGVALKMSVIKPLMGDLTS